MSHSQLIARDAERPYASVAGQRISAGNFVADILHCAEQLPDQGHLINLCSDRYQFSVSFFAAIVRGQVNLLPSKRSAKAIDELRSGYPDVAVITDQEDQASDVLVQCTPGAHGTAPSPTVAAQQTVAVAFTSGSTGAPQPHAKSWGLLSRSRNTHARYLPGDPQQLRGLVATVPSWHMYGLEWALMLPTASEFQLYCGNDFFPQDVMSALATFKVPTTLISTPVHLKALLKSPRATSSVRNTLSATAPLSDSLAQQVETHLQTELFEIYGCSELGSLACRETVREQGWQFFDDLNTQLDGETLFVSAPELPDRVELADCFRRDTQNTFTLLGRASDIIKVGGKRESLANLNNTLLRIDGVEDGVFYEPTRFDLKDTGRLAALVVAPQLDTATLRSQLAEAVDPLFLPRPIHLVDQLPRESTSKLQLDRLRTLIHQQYER